MTQPTLEDDDDDNWLPLEGAEEREAEVPPIAQGQHNTSRTTQLIPTSRNRSPAVNPTSRNQSRSTNDHEADLRRLQIKLESKTKLKKGLVDHPLDQAWQRFIVHLGRELWGLELSVRVGVVLVIIGSVFQMIVMSTMFPWYHPRTIVLVVLFGAAWFYLMPSDPQDLISMIRLHKLSASQGRILFLATFFVPTWLEARTLGFLSQVMCQAGWGYNLSVTAIITAILVYRRTKQPLLSPRHHYIASIYILYGSALWVSLLHFNIRNIPSTAGPFLLSSGTLLLSRADQQQYTRALRHAMRLTLRDTLATLSDNVQQDEMLQLAMLRWIVDYWSTRPESPSTTPPPPPSTAPSSSSAAASSPSPVVELLESETQSRPAAAQSQGNRGRPASSQRRPSSRRQLTNGEEIQWNDLMPMLDMTTNQMEDEVRHSPESQDNESVNNLRQMLSTMDVDGHARPAVDAYKQYIQEFPPSRDTALLISVARRCPASLLIAWRYLMASPFAIPSTLTLLPFVFIEVKRVMGWAESCHQSVVTGEQESVKLSFSVETFTSIPQQIDPMSLLFSPDRYTPLRPPTLLQVWLNIQGSVRALEKGLTAARCAHTTAVAADFADNVMSLAQLGFEVSQKGWVHGLGIMTQELIHLHSTSQEGRYTTAAKSAIRNSQAISRNVQVLVEEDAPIIGFLQGVVGRGWLWGREHDEPPLPESTVTITEIDDDEEEDAPGEHQEQGVSDEVKPETEDDEKKDFPVKHQEKEVTDEIKPDVVVETVSVSDQDVKEVAKLVKSARDRGFISDPEKKSFTKILRDNPDKSAFESIKKSLMLIVDEGEAREKEQQRQIDEVLEVKEMMKKVHDLGLIGEVQKTSFEAILERQPGKSAILKATLTSILDKEEASPTKSQPSLSPREDISNATQRIDGAYERGLISETEKTSFSEILAAEPEKSAVEKIIGSVDMLEEAEGRHGSVNHAHGSNMISDEENGAFEDLLTNEPHDGVAESVKRTLTGILEESQSKAGTGAETTIAEAPVSMPEHGAEEAEVSDNEDLPPIYSSSSWEETSQMDKVGTVAETTTSSESPVLMQEPGAGEAGVRDNEDLPAIYSNSSWEETSQVDNESKTGRIGAPSWEAQTTQAIEPKESTPLSPEVARRLKLESDEVPSAEGEEKGDDFAKWIGGGLAILGAVVGTVAMHHSNQEGDRRRDRNQTEGGRVVELSSEPDDDGWVDVPDS